MRKLGRPRKEGMRLTNVPLYLDRDIVDLFEETLPRHKSISEAVREYMTSVVEESKKVKT